MGIFENFRMASKLFYYEIFQEIQNIRITFTAVQLLESRTNENQHNLLKIQSTLKTAKFIKV